MLSWILALVLGPAFAIAQYRLGGASHHRRMLALRAVAATVLLLLLFDAPIGIARLVRPYVALDASASWLAAGDTTLWKRAIHSADSVGTDTLLLVGDTVRAGKAPALPMDRATRAAPLVERALGAGRAVTFVTDGRVDDPRRLDELPAGSHIVLVDAPPRRDAAVASLDAPASAVAGDTVDITAVVAAGSGGALAGKIELFLDATSIATAKLDSLGPFGEREVRARVSVGPAPGARLLRAIVTSAVDAVPRNDTLTAVLDVAAGASAVFLSTSPDYDARFALEVLRGTLAVPTRGYFRVAPGQWRVDGNLTAVTEDEVKKHVLEAPLVVLHGDTAVFGPPRDVTHGALALFAPPAQRGDDFYPTSAPPSPLTATLASLPWDSLPPVELADAGRNAEWVAVSAKRGRRLDERAVVSGTSHPRRIVVVPAAGLWRWRFRGGRAADVYVSLWGSIFDWMTGDAVDRRGIRPVSSWLREGEPVRWRRGGQKDSVASVVLQRRGSPRADTLVIRFAGASSTAESAPLAPGVYATRAGDATGLLSINESAEWVPRRPNVRIGAIGSAPAAGRAPRARGAWWMYALALAALCAEWIIRRRIGLR